MAVTGDADARSGPACAAPLPPAATLIMPEPARHGYPGFASISACIVANSFTMPAACTAHS